MMPKQTESPYPMLSVADALGAVLAQAQPLPSIKVDLSDALGMTLTEDVHAQQPLPPFPASIKDGYAVIAADGPGDYPVAGEVTAGRLAEFTLQPGSVAYITTGAPMPVGADAVVMIEETEPLDISPNSQIIRIKPRVSSGDDVRAVGSDIEAGKQVLAAGDLLGPAEIGLLATVGVALVPVHRRPRVALLSTGDELVEPAEMPGPGQIRDSNRPTLRAVVEAIGAEVVDGGIAGDSQQQLEARVNHCLQEADVLVTSGGVSMGELDLLKPLLENRGQVHFGRVRMKPGKPLTFATTVVDDQRKLIFALPGNPVSSLVTFYLFGVPALRRMAGWPDPHLPRVQAQLAEPLPLDAYRQEFHRASLRWDSSLNQGRGGFVAVSTGSQASSRLLSMRTANALLQLPQREGTLQAGDLVTALIIGNI